MKRISMRGRRTGLALVEFSLVTPLLLLALAGVLNYALALRTAASVTDAARIGAWYGSQSPANASNTAAMQAAALPPACKDVLGQFAAQQIGTRRRKIRRPRRFLQ